MTGALQSSLYFGTVIHQRLKPRRHRLAYKVCYGFFDIDELPELDRRFRVFSFNRPNLFSFCNRDHGPGEDGDLRPWVERMMLAGGIEPDGGPIRVLCLPRILGYAFNPLSTFFCYRRDGRLTAVLYEVNNTFGERHCYLSAVDPEEGRVLRHRCAKAFYVSPFIEMAANYRFRITVPGDRAMIAISESDEEGPLLHATFNAERGDLSDTPLTASLFRYPLLTAKVIGGIHWEALRLWLKKIPLVRRPAPPEHAVTLAANTSPITGDATK
ncbi:MAG: DUF1365 domain-containing protein [Rhodospirillales bacterium]|nr:DUF1365 domain-containing protein [Rhodospirillales bacterium]